MENSIFIDRMAFNFYRSYYDTSLLLDGEDKAEFLEAILHYQFTGELVEPKRERALLAFRGQWHSLKKQVLGFEQGKKTYPTGHPNKGSGKQVQDKGKDKKDTNVFCKYKNQSELWADYPSTYTFIAYMFWKLWYTDQETKTLKDAKIADWTDEIRKIIELDGQSVERLIAVYQFFKQCHFQESGFDSFWFNTIKSVGGFRKKNKEGVYCLDQIAAKVNEKIARDSDFGRLVENKIKQFKEHESIKLS